MNAQKRDIIVDVLEKMQDAHEHAFLAKMHSQMMYTAPELMDWRWNQLTQFMGAKGCAVREWQPLWQEACSQMTTVATQPPTCGLQPPSS